VRAIQFTEFGDLSKRHMVTLPDPRPDDGTAVVRIKASSVNPSEFDVVDFYHNEGRIFGADSRKLDIAASAAILAGLVPGFESGAYAAPVIAATYTLEDARAAYEAVANGTAGRVVITP
jgi:NADPH:quinone reductase-like Zn-dependent oxidoreductase